MRHLAEVDMVKLRKDDQRAEKHVAGEKHPVPADGYQAAAVRIIVEKRMLAAVVAAHVAILHLQWKCPHRLAAIGFRRHRYRRMQGPRPCPGMPSPFSGYQSGGGWDGVGTNDGADGRLAPCRHCGRQFQASRLQKHVNICVKVFQKQRKQFNAMEHAMPKEAIVAAKAAAKQQKKKGVGKGAKAEEAGGKAKWKQQSEAFRQAIKQARLVDKFQKEGRPLSQLPANVPTSAELDDRTQCPHCGRRFGEQQAERHIPQCAKTKAKPRPPPAARPPPAGGPPKPKARC